MEHEIKTWQWVVTVIVIITLILIGILVFSESPSHTDECEQYSEMKLSEVPAKCVRYYNYYTR